MPRQPARSLLQTQLQANTTLSRGWIPQLVQRKIIKTRENITKKKNEKAKIQALQGKPSAYPPQQTLGGQKKPHQNWRRKSG